MGLLTGAMCVGQPWRLDPYFVDGGLKFEFEVIVKEKKKGQESTLLLL